ncbi:MAG: polysaccharide pyruvyl transferase family protein [Candidatus Saccharibacteria bacterium]|nr:polysaccharide pyruvyl transferase family protein [Candidatus Saccharibacteria bacterium]
MKVVKAKKSTARKHTFRGEKISDEYFRLLSSIKPDSEAVLICGFLGAKNVGDELMFEAVIRQLSEKQKATIMLSNNYESPANDYAPYPTVHFPIEKGDYLVLAELFGNVMLCGGAMIDDTDYVFLREKSTMAYVLLNTVKTFIEKGRRASVIGVSANQEISNKAFICDLQYIIDNATHFSLRDENSLYTLILAGINTRPIKIIDDLSLACNFENWKPKERKNVFRIGFAHIYTEDSFTDIQKFSADIVKEAGRLTGKKIEVSLIPFYTYKNHDQKYCARLAKHLDAPTIVLSAPNSARQLCQIYSECDIIISARYHAILIATVLGCKILAIDYSKKHRHYPNKIHYIKQKYNRKLELVDFDRIAAGHDYLGSFRRALKKKNRPFSKRRLQKIQKKTNSIIKKTKVLTK